MKYKLKNPTGITHTFVSIDGDTTAEEQIADYWFDGCTVELWQTSLAFRDEFIREVPIDEIRATLD